METEINTCGIHLHKDEEDLETGGIWEDAGFKPPQFCMQLIESLHLMFLNEGCIPEFYLKEIIAIIKKPASGGLFVIDDSKKMYCFAKSLGIDVLGGDEGYIAAKITGCIISDYVLPDGISPVTERMIFSGKNRPVQKYPVLKV